MIGAIDIGGTKIATGIYDENGTPLARRMIPTGAKAGPAAAIFRVVKTLRELMIQTDTKLDGIGIGCTGPVYPLTGTVGVTDLLPGWEGFDLVGSIEKATGVRAYLENDADAAALGEWAWGEGRGASSFLLVTIGTGIGVGVILDGKLYRGVQGSHPEIGHHFLDPDGPACACGGNGCWESLASGPAMETWAKAQNPEMQSLTAFELCQAADQGNEYAIKAVEREAYYLGLGLVNLVTIFTPDIIALAGGVIRSHHLFLPKIEEMVNKMTAYVPHERCKIVVVKNDADPGLRGAAQVWIQANNR